MQVAVGILICILALVGLYFAVKAVFDYDPVGPDTSNEPGIHKKTIDIGRDLGFKDYIDDSAPDSNTGTRVIYPWGSGRGTNSNNNTPDYKPSENPNDYSPYYGYVRISYLSLPSYPQNVGASFTLTGGSLDGINITGWQLKGNRANVVISRAINNLNMSGSFTPSDIILGPNSYVYAYDRPSPINASFRLNKCTGYLNNSFNFSPKLPEYCPKPYSSLSDIVTFTGECQNYIRSIGTCDEPTAANKNRLSFDAACRVFMDKIGFSECYKNHQYDRDFLKNDWRLFLRQEFAFDRLHDRIQLLDSKGLLVHEYIY